jgi:hypothetical protein
MSGYPDTAARPVVRAHIPFVIGNPELADRLGREAGKSLDEETEAIIAEALRIARPKAVFRRCRIEERRNEETVIEGISFRGRLLSVNLENTREAFAYVATCGRELAEWASGFSGPLERYLADVVSEMAAHRAEEFLYRNLETEYGLTKASTMNPGSLTAWQISEQAPLFSLIGDVEGLIGVSLSQSFVMSPIKSISGIRFATEDDFMSCALCARDPCRSRRAEYDGGLFARRYGKTG